jgi:hypothetical protein
MTASLAPVGLLSFRGLRKNESSSVIRTEATLSDQIPAWFDAVARKCASLVELESNSRRQGEYLRCSRIALRVRSGSVSSNRISVSS